MGYVYYGNYAMYYEVARVEAFRKLGFPYKNLEDMGIGMPVLSMDIKYKKAGKYDELLTVRVSIPTMPSVKIRFDYEVINEAGEIINIGTTTLAFMRMDSYKPVRMPQVMHELLTPYFGEKD